MARITVSTIKDKRERNQTPVFPKSCTPEGFYIWNPELDFTYHELAFDCNSLNVKDIHKGGNMAFGLIYYSFMLNTEEMGSVYV